MEGRTNITEVRPDDETKPPRGLKKTLVNQCGYYVRENIPISFKLWKKSKATDNDADAISDTEKEMLWREVKMHFDFPDDKEEVLKKWVVKKMAISFQTFKKNMSIDYVKMGFTPLRNTSRRNVNIGMHSCSISCWRTVRSKQEGTKKMKAKVSTLIILGKEVIRR
jgi:hypothetical protein